MLNSCQNLILQTAKCILCEVALILLGTDPRPQIPYQTLSAAVTKAKVRLMMRRRLRSDSLRLLAAIRQGKLDMMEILGSKYVASNYAMFTYSKR